jgi:hypothetical protein
VQQTDLRLDYKVATHPDELLGRLQKKLRKSKDEVSQMIETS